MDDSTLLSHEVELVPHDMTQPNEPAAPKGLEPVGICVFSPRSPSFSAADVLLDPDKDVKPGEFLLVLHNHDAQELRASVVQVGQCREINPNETPELATARRRLALNRMYASEAASMRIHRIAESEGVEEFCLHRAGDNWALATRHAIELLPRAGCIVVRIPPSLMPTVVGALNDPGQGLDLGHFAGTGTRAVLVNKLLQLGVLTVGNPGSGKSYLTGVMLEECAAWDIPCVIIDVNGEFSAPTKALGGKVITLPNKSEFGLTLNLLTPSELIDVTPNIDPAAQYAQLIELAHERLRNEAERNGNKRISFQDLLAMIQSLGQDMSVAATSIRTAVSRVTTLSKDELFAGDFDFLGALGEHRIVCLDCRYLSLRQTRLISAAAARVLQRHGRQMSRKADAGDLEAAKWFALLVIDEAHMVAPAAESAISTQVLYELARMGRHVRTGLMLSTQSPADLDRSILKRLQTRFVFNLERDQLAAIGGINSDFGDQMLDQVPKLPQGACAVTGTTEAIRHGFFMKGRERRTPVSGGTPPVFEGRVKRTSGD